MSKHDEFCDELSDYMPYDYDPNDPTYNYDISTFSMHPVNESYELTEETLLGKGDVHFEDIFDKYRKKIKDIEKAKNSRER